MIVKLDEIQKKCDILTQEAEQLRATFKVRIKLSFILASIYFVTQQTCGMEYHLEQTNTFTVQLKTIYMANLKHSKFV